VADQLVECGMGTRRKRGDRLHPWGCVDAAEAACNLGARLSVPWPVVAVVKSRVDHHSCPGRFADRPRGGRCPLQRTRNHHRGMFRGQRLRELCGFRDPDPVQWGIAQPAQPIVGVERGTAMAGQVHPSNVGRD